MIDRDDDVKEESDDMKRSSLEELELANTSYEEISPYWTGSKKSHWKEWLTYQKLSERVPFFKKPCN